MGYSFRLVSRVIFYAASHRQDNTYQGLCDSSRRNWPEREIAQCVHPMNDRSDDPSHHERTLLPRSYISLRDRPQTPIPWRVMSFHCHHQTTLSWPPGYNYWSTRRYVYICILMLILFVCFVLFYLFFVSFVCFLLAFFLSFFFLKT